MQILTSRATNHDHPVQIGIFGKLLGGTGVANFARVDYGEGFSSGGGRAGYVFEAFGGDDDVDVASTVDDMIFFSSSSSFLFLSPVRVMGELRNDLLVIVKFDFEYGSSNDMK
eukprot:CAMPEP_0171347840 /NCGR_PEP_ID=MMETSP0878-20121228/29210_1 /TAXON_ID=67004 /ORGANISM="Thalassiosira weissflogii, Strain CCMP1336" /LENGTH=112 /DNA_ID=CAMNT_0011852005 /DNA_START=1 /DNA_END=340 /DNA_ORIENTATION=-